MNELSPVVFVCLLLRRDACLYYCTDPWPPQLSRLSSRLFLLYFCHNVSSDVKKQPKPVLHARGAHPDWPTVASSQIRQVPYRAPGPVDQAQGRVTATPPSHENSSGSRYAELGVRCNILRVLFLFFIFDELQ